MEHSAWFKTWFNSPFYHILYKHRDDTEARIFMSNLAEYLHLPPKASILDAACGKGRHSAFLSSNGFKVTGFDLAPESIAYAKQQYADLPNLEFFVHDIRETFKATSFDYVFNLFTSFGYFETDEENIKTIQALANSLHNQGVLVIDFFNANKVTKMLPHKDQKNLDGIDFLIEKSLQNRIIVKDIRFEHEGNPYHFQERVMAITEQDFKSYFNVCGLSVQACFGSYSLEKFDLNTSERMIWILKK
ncbi:MAG: class I SAM-dependent methyltransferase [Raineya sp.]|jgi:SAM-dependent methyltransferase|nr:class I SAM-dependent methyltransferase [Raineya sp.]